MLFQAEYSEVRPQMRTGDVLAFGGKGPFADLIKWVCGKVPVSHVGMVLETRIQDGVGNGAGDYLQIAESASVDGKTGVVISRLSARVKTYDGDLWWLPLAREVRERMDARKLVAWLMDQNGKPYDLPGAVAAGLDILDDIFGEAREDFTWLFCSEYMAGGLEIASAVGTVNASEVTPIDICRWCIYGGRYVQLKGQRREIRGWNTREPE